MKKSAAIILALFLTATLLANAMAASVLTITTVKIATVISLNGNTVTTVVSGTEPKGCTMKLTLRIQEYNGSSWSNVSSPVIGNVKAKVLFTGVSGRSYRGYYTYRLYDESGILLESGSGYTNVKKIC